MGIIGDVDESERNVILEEISKFIFTSRYARYKKKLKRRETWLEAVERVENMHLNRFDFLDDSYKKEIQRAFDFVRHKRVVPSMRSLQFGGKAIEAQNARIFNCAVRHIDSIDAFSEVFFLLLCGCGVGIGLRDKFFNRVPQLVKEIPSEEFTYVIPDTIEGWAESLKVLLKSFTEGHELTGKKIIFDYSQIRPEGAPLVTSGGKAPGSAGLQTALEHMEDLLLSRIGKGLRIVDGYDILMHSADAVLSGGVRRAATSVVFDIDNEDMMHAKTGNWQLENPQRARSNNSVLLMRDRLTIPEFEEIVQKTREWGEPGFVFADHPDTLFNPCFEISFIPVTKDGKSGVQFCVSGDTTLITEDGITSIKKEVGKEISIWNGKNWAKVKPVLTQKNGDLYRVSFNDGSYLDCTSNHRFLVQKTWEHENDKRKVTSKQKGFYEMSLEEIMKDKRKGKFRIPRADINISFNGKQIKKAYDYGYFKGDGHIGGKHRKIQYVRAMIYGSKDLGLDLNIRPVSGEMTNKYGTTYKEYAFDTLDVKFSKQLKLQGIPDEIFSWDRQSILQFVAGWIDADGSNASKGVRLYGDEPSIRKAQFLLTKTGIRSSVNLMAKKGEINNFGIRKSDVWYLQITKTIDIPCRRVICNNSDNAKFKGKYQGIENIKKLEGKYDSYCFEEKQLHQGLFNNVLTKQCNLSSVNGAKVRSEEDFYESVRAASIIGTLQAAYTDFKYLGDEARELTEAESLLGVSITGIMDNPEILLGSEIQRNGANIAVSTNKRWSGILGINQAARVTALKPEGSSTLVLESMASGIHPAHSHTMFRRVQMNKQNNVYQFFREHNPHLCEESVWSKNKTDDIITFPVKLHPKVMIKNDLTAVEHLTIIRDTQVNWVNTGTTIVNTKPLTHNISSTVVVKEDEWEEVISFLYHNKQLFTAVSLIADSGDKDYPQAPNEAVVTEEDMFMFTEMLENFNSVPYEALEEEDDKTKLSDTDVCSGGACSLEYLSDH